MNRPSIVWLESGGAPAARFVLWACSLAAVLIVSGCGGGVEAPENHRAAAEWALKRGGTVAIAEQDLAITSPEELPEEPFTLRRIELNRLEKPVTDADLAQLPDPLPGLRYLGLHSAQVTDAGVEHLLELQSLRELELSYTRITDDGLDALRALPNIETIYLYGTRVSAEAVERFGKTHPDCRVLTDPADRAESS